MPDESAIAPSLQTGGVDPLNPITIFVTQRAPVATKASDTNQKDGTQYLDHLGNAIYEKLETVAGQGIWLQIGFSSTTPASVSVGGTGRSTLTAHAVLVGEGTSPVGFVGPAASGLVLIAAGVGSDPAFGALGVNSGLTAHGVLMGEGNSAIAASTAGSSGQVFTSGGASADGAYQALGFNSGLTLNGVLLGQTNAAIIATAAGLTGTALVGVTGAPPVFSALSEINIVDVTGSTSALFLSTTHIADAASATVVFTLPTTAAVGTTVKIVGNGPGGWSVAQNAGQNIKLNSQTTTTGTGGSLSSTNRYNTVELYCTVANTTFVAVTGGTLTLV